MTSKQPANRSPQPYLHDLHEDDPHLCRVCDALDDRIAEIVEEVLAQQTRRYRLRPELPLTVLVIAAVGISVLRGNPLAVASVWASAAFVCQGLIRIGRTCGGSR